MIVKEFGTVDLAELDIAAFLTALTQMAGRHNIEVPSTVTTVGRAWLRSKACWTSSFLM